MESMQWAEIQSKEQIYLGRASTFVANRPRIQVVIEKIVKGVVLQASASNVAE